MVHVEEASLMRSIVRIVMCANHSAICAHQRSELPVSRITLKVFAGVPTDIGP